MNETMYYNSAQLAVHGGGYGLGTFSAVGDDMMSSSMPGCSHSFLPIYDRGFSGAMPTHSQRLHPLTAPASLGNVDTDFEALGLARMPMSCTSQPGTSTMGQGNMNLSLPGLLNDTLLEHMVQLGINEGFAGNPPGKRQEDLESDSGLSLDSSPALASPVNSTGSVLIGDGSLTYSDAESLDVEGMEYGRLRSENAEMYPMDFHMHPHYRVLPSIQHMSTMSVYQIEPSETPPGFTGLLGNNRAQYVPSKRANRDTSLSRDQRRAFNLKIPFSTDEIINLPVDDFNELLSKYQLAEPQLALIRDIRRRGKNKVAAQNCRKRKLDNIVHLEHDLNHLKSEKDQLVKERVEFNRTLCLMKQKLNELYRQVFTVLRDGNGHPYSPEEFSLQQTNDGSIFIVPRGMKEGKD
eukprot:gi/632988378/ref/XP_007883079.1/ PREDICTED: transcription factor NF-E2 45 kDa subunit [Callorhinchus milii]